jgi:peptidoglycan/LPS O-acetylase OafA/YrhL
LEPQALKLLSHLSRITTAGKIFIPQIDGLRFVAILAVLAYHIRSICNFHFGIMGPVQGTLQQGWLSLGFESGHMGVQLFFTISGFILSLPFATRYLNKKSPPSLRDYYVRRITRIEPPYIIHLMIVFLLCILVLRRLPSHPNLYQNPAWFGFVSAHILSSLVYANGIIFGVHPYPNIVLWSLEVEVQFYIVAPFLAKIFSMRSAYARRTIITVVIVLFSIVSSKASENYRIGFTLAGNLQYFLAGFLLADFYLAGWLKTANSTLRWDFVLLCCAAAVCFIELYPVWLLVLPWIILLFCIGAFRGRCGAQLLGNRWIVTIGGMCYTIYMYHWFMISGLIRATHRIQTHVAWLDLLVQFCIMAPIIIVISSALFFCFERPFMRKDWHLRIRAALLNQFGKTNPYTEPNSTSEI